MTTTLAPATGSNRQRAAHLFHALSDETRLAVLDLLRSGERCVCELQDALDVAQSRLSFHLRVLKDAGLVIDRREGRWAYYTLQMAALTEASEMLRTLAAHERSSVAAPLLAAPAVPPAVITALPSSPRSRRALRVVSSAVRSSAVGGSCCE